MLALIKKLSEKNIYLSLSDNDLVLKYDDDDVLTADIIREIRDNKPFLVRYLSQANSQNDYQGIPRIAEAEDYAASDGQRRIWILSQLEDASRAYNMPNTEVLEGDHSKALLEQAIQMLISRHEILHTVFRENEQHELRQVVLPAHAVAFHLEYEEAAHKTAAELAALIDAYSATAFDLEKGPLLKGALLKTGPRRYILHFNMHHIISDGWSMALLIKEVLGYYEGLQKGIAAALPPLAIQYKDYAAWQKRELLTARYQQHRSYWLQQLGGELPLLSLPSDKIRPALLTYNGHGFRTLIPEGQVKQLLALCQQQHTTLFMGLAALLKTLFYRYTGQEDIIVGSPVAGREHADLADQIGFYVNTVALRTRFNGTDSFLSLMEKVKEVTLGAYEHQMYPFDAIVQELHLQRDMSRSPIFDVTLVLQNQQEKGISVNGVTDETAGDITDLGPCPAKLDLLFAFAETMEGLQMEVHFNTDVYDKGHIKRLMEHYKRLLQAAVTAPDSKLWELDYLSSTEQQQLLNTFNDTAVTYPTGRTLLDLFREQVAAHGNAVALVHKGEQWSYEQLDKLSNQLAHYLQTSYGVGREELVCVEQHRSEWLVICLLGVLKAGCAYVPIDPGFPAERKSFIRSDTRSKVCLDEVALARFLNEQNQYPDHDPGIQLSENNLAYVLYTSGSTGQPKGCMLEHKGVVNRLEWMWRAYGFNTADVVLQKTTFTFDVSVWELFLPLCWGCKMVLSEDEDIYSPDRLLRLIGEQGVSTLH
ncbi:MAG TPA: condensation domain-containing protein, partial [Chitinophaga sp.]|uniref:non-ribosomal peptide synthetase n=1 Tax=Chitinophaga sp. TaxID=1869181 RepID=UPI002DBD4ABC